MAESVLLNIAKRNGADESSPLRFCRDLSVTDSLMLLQPLISHAYLRLLGGHRTYALQMVESQAVAYPDREETTERQRV